MSSPLQQHRHHPMPSRQEKRLRQWEHRPQPRPPLFPEPDPPIWKPLG